MIGPPFPFWAHCSFFFSLTVQTQSSASDGDTPYNMYNLLYCSHDVPPPLLRQLYSATPSASSRNSQARAPISSALRFCLCRSLRRATVISGDPQQGYVPASFRFCEFPVLLRVLNRSVTIVAKYAIFSTEPMPLWEDPKNNRTLSCDHCYHGVWHSILGNVAGTSNARYYANHCTLLWPLSISGQIP